MSRSGSFRYSPRSLGLERSTTVAADGNRLLMSVDLPVWRAPKTIWTKGFAKSFRHLLSDQRENMPFDTRHFLKVHIKILALIESQLPKTRPSGGTASS